MLFGGAVPPNGFMVQPFLGNSVGGNFSINDNGPASRDPTTGQGTGFNVKGTEQIPFTTPPGYKPMGPVSVNCTFTGASFYIAARAW
jgi:hypothetical protein